ncbi:MAG: beta-ureidopropionase [Planctomycetota bacterium]|jgi:beta-ureidopropionase
MLLRAAMTQTRNAFAPMPGSVEELTSLAAQLDAIREANLDHHEELIRAASAAGARVIGLGELFPAPYFALGRQELWRECAEDAREGPTVSRMRHLARELQIVIVAPIYELDARSGLRFNTAVVIDDDGRWLGRYRKTHIPMGTNERASFDESFYYSSSNGQLDNTEANISTNAFLPVFETSVGRLGVAICYDRHFSSVIEILSQQGAQLVFSPAVTFGKTSERMWELEFPVDCCRHRVFIGGSNREGAEAPWGVEFFGRSYFCGPSGKRPRLESRPELVISDLDTSEVESAGDSGWDLKRDARPELRQT